MNCLRLAVVGSSQGPNLFEIFETLGKAETLSRIDRALKEIPIPGGESPVTATF
jgi:glutamyl-tRNA synthetase